MSEPRVVDGIEGLRTLIGVELGPTEPIPIDQAMVNAFADVTQDHQFIHTDPERAAREGPFGGTVAHGFLVLSLVPPLLFGQLLRVQNTSAALNYGSDRVQTRSGRRDSSGAPGESSPRGRDEETRRRHTT